MRDRLERLQAALRALETADFATGVALCRPLVATGRPDVEAKLLFALALAGQGKAARAARLLNEVACLRPAMAHPCSDLAGLVAPTALAAQYRACLRLTPHDARLRLAFGSFLQQSGAPGQAIEVLGGRLESAAEHHLLGLALADIGRFTEAIAQFRAVVAIDPVPAMGWANVGMLLKVEGQFDAALAAYDTAIALSPNNAQIRVNRAVALLRAGRWTEAWRDYEWRLRLPGHTTLPLSRLLPSLDTPARLDGKTILVTHEEGFGDTLQFVRYLKALAGLGARVILAVPEELRRLLRGLEGPAEVIASGGRLPDHDFHCPVFSLPRVFGTTIDTVPAETPYVTADPALVAAYAARLPAGDEPRVGLVWAGQARPWLPGFTTLDQRRSTTLATLAPLGTVSGVRFISLQKGAAAAEARTPPAGLTLYDPMAAAHDFADTAAIIANLDLVISVDTSVVHLAGALGKPVFLLDRYDNCWRWLSGRDDSPWYPRLRIFRQEQIGDWPPVIERVATALTGLAAHAFGDEVA